MLALVPKSVYRGVPPELISGKPTQSRSEYIAARQADRFFCEVKRRSQDVAELADGQCFTLVCLAVKVLVHEIEVEEQRLNDDRFKQLELEGLLSASDRAAVNQALLRLSR